MTDYKLLFKEHSIPVITAIIFIIAILISFAMFYIFRSNLIPIINNNKDVFNLAFTSVVSISTFVYAILTVFLVDETLKARKIQSNSLNEAIRTRELQNRPKIAVFLRSKEGSINIVETMISNYGAIPARNIKFVVIGDIKNLSDKQITDIGPIKEGIQHLEPDGKLLLFAVNMLENTKDKIKTEINVSIKYSDYLGSQEYYDAFILNYSELEGTIQIGHPPLKGIEEEIESIRRNIESYRREEWERYREERGQNEQQSNEHGTRGEETGEQQTT